jgi:hypothetical protein
MFSSSKPSVAPVAALDTPEPLSNILAEDKKLIQEQDCLPCRTIGAGAFIGLGVYSYITGHSQLRAAEKEILKSGKWIGMRTRRAGITGMAATLVGLGLYRFVN